MRKATHIALPAGAPSWAKRAFDPTDCQKLSKLAADSIRELGALAKRGSGEAASEMHRAVAVGVQLLRLLCKSNPDLFVTIASEKFFWPIMYSPHSESVKESNEFLRRIQLGGKRHINICSGKTFSWEVPANVVAINLHQLARDVQRVGVDLLNDPPPSVANCGVGVSGIEGSPKAIFHLFDDRYKQQLKELEAWGQEGVGSSLPELSKETAGQWAKAADELFLIAYGRKTFEKHPHLQELRESVLGWAKDSYGKSGRGVVRKAMRQAVKQAWHSIAGVD